MPIHSIIPRLTAFIALAGSIAAILIPGAEQFGLAYMGTLGGAAWLLKTLFGKAAIVAVIAPLIAIALMIALALLLLLTIAGLAFRASVAFPKKIVRKLQFWPPFFLSCSLLVGLVLLRLFPGDQVQPLSFSNNLFIYPTFLLIAAVVLTLSDRDETSGQELSKTR